MTSSAEKRVAPREADRHPESAEPRTTPSASVAARPASDPLSGNSVSAPTHDKDMAAQFLACLDPNADRFTFQFFGDGPDKYAEIYHGTLDEVWPKIRALNTLERRVAVFVTVNETDLKGRRGENIVRPRALFVDADSTQQISSCMDGIGACGATPSVVVKSGKGLHFYWLCPDIPRDQFSALQKNLIVKLGSDPAVNDLPRVMRLPGTLHLKDHAKPRLVTLCQTNSPLHRWNASELVAKLGLSRTEPVVSSNVVPFNLPDWVTKKGPAAAFADLPVQSLAAGLEPDIEEIRSAVEAIPPSAIATEPEWMRLARALAHEAAVFKKLADPLWAILDTASRRAPGYNAEENRRRFDRYIREALSCANPITIASVYHLASGYGWQGRCASHIASSNTTALLGYAGPSSASANPGGSTGAMGPSNGPAGPTNGPTVPRAVPVSSLPLVPAKRKWVHGTDLVRNAVSILYAPGGRAKSSWLISCALACASGRPLLGAHIFGGPLRVLYLSTEDAVSEVALRIRAAMKHHGLTDADVPGLHVIGADHWGLPLLQVNGSGPSIEPRGWNALTSELDRINPDILIIDPLINVLGGVNSNDNSAAALLMGRLTELAARRRISVVLAHHASKGRDPMSPDSAMGAASFINLARIGLSIEPLAEKDAGAIGVPPWDAKSIFRVIGTKQNFSAPNASDRWFRIVSVPMQNAEPPIYTNGDQVAVVEPFQPGISTSAFPVSLVRDALLAVDGANPPLSPSKRSSERYAAPVIAYAIARHRGGQASELDGKAVLDHLLSAGLVEVTEVKVFRPGKGSDTRKGLVLTSAGREAVQQVGHPTPQPPQHHCRMTRAGSPLAPPQRQGGMGGMRGASATGQMPLRVENEHVRSHRNRSSPPVLGGQARPSGTRPRYGRIVGRRV